MLWRDDASVASNKSTVYVYLLPSYDLVLDTFGTGTCKQDAWQKCDVRTVVFETFVRSRSTFNIPVHRLEEEYTLLLGKGVMCVVVARTLAVILGR
jgi:hypothetical protein